MMSVWKVGSELALGFQIYEAPLDSSGIFPVWGPADLHHPDNCLYTLVENYTDIPIKGIMVSDSKTMRPSYREFFEGEVAMAPHCNPILDNIECTNRLLHFCLLPVRMQNITEVFNVVEKIVRSAQRNFSFLA